MGTVVLTSLVNRDHCVTIRGSRMTTDDKLKSPRPPAKKKQFQHRHLQQTELFKTTVVQSVTPRQKEDKVIVP